MMSANAFPCFTTTRAGSLGSAQNGRSSHAMRNETPRLESAMNILIISCSLSPDSRSRVLCAEAQRILLESRVESTLFDLRDHPLPMCDGEDCDPKLLAPLRDAIQHADAIVLGVPIYNYDVNAAAKNLVELTGSAWEGKIVGFL